MSNDSNFDSLFTPFSIGKMEIKNRLEIGRASCRERV